MLRMITLFGIGAAVLSAQGPRQGMGAGDFALVRAEFGAPNKVVAGAPYSAQAVTTFTQTLANGDHIQRNSTASVARDSQGRTRTERSFGSIGALAAAGASGKTVVIFDPVANMSYVLDPAKHTAHSRSLPGGRWDGAFAPRRTSEAKTEDLGTQNVQGVAAQGKRLTRVIAAGAQGNDKEIDIVTETWYSPDLQVVVMSKTNDPRFGESVYQLTSIRRAEPDASLFTVPSDYAVQDAHPMRRERPAAH